MSAIHKVASRDEDVPSFEDKKAGSDGNFQDGALAYEVSVSDADAAIAELVAVDQSHDIQLRTMSWQKTALLLAGDQVCLAIMAQSWSYMVLGWTGGLITSLLSGLFFWATSITMWRYIMAHPEIKDICDFGYYIFGRKRWAYEFSAFMLIVNNVMLIGFHTLTATKILNTLSGHSLCSVSFAAISTVIGIVMSIPRTLNHVSYMCIVSAACMGIAILLFLIFAGIEANPYTGYNGVWPTDGAAITTTAFPLPANSNFVAIMNAVLNITFLFVPQALFPSFIAEMKRPQDFPKSLAVLVAISFVLFIVPAALGYYFLGQYSTAPAFGSLQPKYGKISFGFVIVPTMVISVIYANVAAKFIYGRIMGNSRHAHSHTVTGWGIWMAVMTAIWGVAFIFAEVIPSMGDFLSIMGAAFDSFFGYIYYAIAYYWLFHKKGFFTSKLRGFETIMHILFFFIGLVLLGPGLYAAIKAIAADYAGATRPAFSCADLSL